MSESLKLKTTKGFVWSGIERFSVQFIQLVIQVLLARILPPEDFGIIGMLAIFLAVAQSFIDSGFSNALIRKIDRTELDNSTVFYFNVGIGIGSYLILYVTAPFIAEFYNTPLLIPVTRVLSIGVFFNSLSIVQRAILTARIDFRIQAQASLIAVILSGAVGLYMAYAGYGVWALVWQAVINYAINTVMLWALTKWIPLWAFSKASFKEMFGFGSKLLLSGLLDTIFRNIYTIVIGKMYPSGELGFYTKANQLAQFPSANLTGIMQRVTYPILCEFQDENERLRYVYRKYLRLSAYVIFPLIVGLAVVAHPLIVVMLTDKWSGAVLLLQILCVDMMWYPIQAINLNLLQVKGRSDLFLRLEIIKKTILVVVLCVTISYGVVGICVGQIVCTLIALAINTYYTDKLINWGFLKQMRDLMPTVFYSVSMGVIVSASMMLVQNNIGKLFIGIVVGVIYYILISIMTKSAELKDILSLLKVNRSK